MTRKDYEAIAAAIAGLLQDVARESIGESLTDRQRASLNGERIGVTQAAYRLMGVFEAGNPAFDRARFLKACGL
jgi:hypothetical protein